MNNITWKKIAVIGIVLFAVGFVTFVFSQPVEVVDKDVNQEVENQEVGSVMKQEFMGGCTTEASDTYCECAYDYMVSKVGESGFVQEGLDFERTGQLTPLMEEAVVECVDQL